MIEALRAVRTTNYLAAKQDATETPTAVSAEMGEEESLSLRALFQMIGIIHEANTAIQAGWDSLSPNARDRFQEATTNELNSACPDNRALLKNILISTLNLYMRARANRNANFRELVEWNNRNIGAKTSRLVSIGNTGHRW